MLTQDTQNKLIELFIALDDFCLALSQYKQDCYLPELSTCLRVN